MCRYHCAWQGSTKRRTRLRRAIDELPSGALRVRVDEANLYYDRPPLVWALDELASLPTQDLPETLSQSGGQGLLIAACLQDLGMVDRKWETHPETFLTLFGDIVIPPASETPRRLKRSQRFSASNGSRSRRPRATRGTRKAGRAALNRTGSSREFRSSLRCGPRRNYAHATR
jgi:hypothetical protein